MNKKQLKAENDQLRNELRTLVEKPDSPEAAVIITQTLFAKELEKHYNTGEPLDTPKLLGLYGKMMNPIPKHKKLPGNEAELKEVLGSFYRWTVSNAIKHNKGMAELLNKDLMDEMLNIFIDKLKDGDFG